MRSAQFDLITPIPRKSYTRLPPILGANEESAKQTRKLIKTYDTIVSPLAGYSIRLTKQATLPFIVPVFFSTHFILFHLGSECLVSRRVCVCVCVVYDHIGIISMNQTSGELCSAIFHFDALRFTSTLFLAAHALCLSVVQLWMNTNDNKMLFSRIGGPLAPTNQILWPKCTQCASPS